MDFTGGTPVERDPSVSKRADRDRRTGTGNRQSGTSRKTKKSHRVAGFTLVGLGLAGLGTGFALHAVRGSRGDDFANERSDIDAQTKWLHLRPGVLVSGAIGGAALTAAMPLVLPHRDKTPWWAWVTGAAGLGVAGFAIHQGVSATDKLIGECRNGDDLARACVDHDQDVDRAALLASLAAPMITMPLVYLLRPKRAQPSVVAHRRGITVSLRKAF